MIRSLETALSLSNSPCDTIARMLTINAPNGDIALPFITFDLESARQRAAERLRFIRGEWLLDSGLGTPWFQEIIQHNQDAGLATAAIVAALREVADVEDVLEVNGELDSETREFRFSATIRTPYGDAQIAI